MVDPILYVLCTYIYILANLLIANVHVPAVVAPGGVSGVSENWSAIPEGTSNAVKGSHIMVTASRNTTVRAY